MIYVQSLHILNQHIGESFMLHLINDLGNGCGCCQVNVHRKLKFAKINGYAVVDFAVLQVNLLESLIRNTI